MQKFSFITVFIILIGLVSCGYITPTGCIPFGVRLALGRNYYNTQQKQMVSIRFNTRNQCPKSYVTIQQNLSIKKFYCQTQRIAYSNYSSYCHICSIDFIQKGQSYQYMTYGWTGSVSDPAIPFNNTNFKSHLIKDEVNIKMLVLADWGYLQLKAQQYDRLDNALNYILSLKQQPDVIYLGGDYAYDLSTNYGVSYQNFLIMLSQISSTWPCIFMTGNHEYYTDDDFMLFNSSFQLYNLTNQNVSSLDLGAYTFVMADPYNILFENTTKTQLLLRFKKQLDKANKNKPLIITTHYPLACSGASTHCKNQRFILAQFFDMMIDYNCIFYIGAHYHTYQRIYPYIKGGDFKIINGPYKLTKTTKYLISVVQGIAGNDKNIVQSYGKLSNYTAALSYNITGYGIMDVNQRLMKYQHFTALDWIKPVDSVMIYFDQLLRKQLSLRQE